MKRLIPLLALLLAVPHSADAQDVNALRNGVRIEVTSARGQSSTGRLLLLRNDSLFYSRAGSETSMSETGVTSLALADVKSVRVSRGRNRALGLLTKGLMGTAIGAGGGALLRAATYTKSQCTFLECSHGQAAFLGGLVGGSLGLVFGSIYGLAEGNERWETVSVPGR